MQISVRMTVSAFIGCALSACIATEEKKADGVKLRVVSGYGSVERIVTNDATQEVIEKTMASLDWNGFHQVILERPNGDWFEVGGSLDPSDGLSAMFEENGEQILIKELPTSVDAMTSLLLGYLSKQDE